MKTEDFERLKNLIDSEGWEVIDTSTNTSFSFEVQKKDIWEGVEFACTENKVYKIKGFDETYIYTSDYACFLKNDLKPSTESAYIEQLKNIAFQKFGEIKDGQKFNTGYGIHTILPNHPEWYYNKHIDFLYYKGLIVYSKGEWAEKLPERVNVRINELYMNCGEFHLDVFLDNAEHLYSDKNKNELGILLVKQIEQFLNDTNNNKD